MNIFGVDVPLWLMLTLAFVYVIYKYTTSTFKAFENSVGVRGPKPYPLIGTLHLLMKKGLVDYDKYLIDTYGKLVSTWDGLKPTLIVADVDILKQIAIKEFHAFPNRIVPDLGSPGNEMINALKGEEWKRVRDLLTPTFSSGRLRRMNEQIQRNCRTLLKNLSSNDKPVDIRGYAGAFSMDVIASTLFSLDIDSQSDPRNDFVTMAKNLFPSNLRNPIVLLMLFSSICNKLFTKLGQSVLSKESIEFFSAIVEKAISQRKEEDDKSRTDFLQMMIKAHENEEKEEHDPNTQTDSKKSRKRGMTHHEVLAQCIIFFVAGHETVANALTFLTYQLALHPEIQEKLRQEISSQIDFETNLPTYDSVNKLDYLDMVISESLRLDPPATRSDRECTEDITINGLFFPKGIRIVIPILWFHRNPEIWPNPDKFDPERFSTEAKARRNPYQYLPFGLGPRNCIGNRLALMEIKMAICTILLRLKIRTCLETKIPVKRDPTSGRPEDCKLLFVPI